MTCCTKKNTIGIIRKDDGTMITDTKGKNKKWTAHIE